MASASSKVTGPDAWNVSGCLTAPATEIGRLLYSALRRWVEDGGDDPHTQSKVSLIGWSNVRLCAIGSPALKRFEARSMTDAARTLGVAPFDRPVRLVREDGGRRDHPFPARRNRRTLRLRASSAHVRFRWPAAGERKPHPRAFGAFPRAVGPLVRAGWFPLEELVRHMTSAAAARFGLVDRGLIRPNMAADLVLFDADVADRATFDEPTLTPFGIAHVWVAGEPVVRDGAPTGRLPGRVIPALWREAIVALPFARHGHALFDVDLPWDVQDCGFRRDSLRFARTRRRERRTRCLLPRRTLSPAAQPGAKSLFPGGRHSLFPAGAVALAPFAQEAESRGHPRSRRHASHLRRSARANGIVGFGVDGLPAQHASRAAASGRRHAQRLRRP